MNKTKMKKNNKKNKRTKCNAVAIFCAATVIAIIFYVILYKTCIFNVKTININGNSKYDYDYILDKSGIIKGEKIFKINRNTVKNKLLKDPYIKKVVINYKLPDKINIEVIERKEKILVTNNNKKIIIDNEGFVLREADNLETNLISIETYVNVVYNIGKLIQVEGLFNFNDIIDLINYYTKYYNNNLVKKIKILDINKVLLETKYGTNINLNIDKDLIYQLEFSFEIIKTRKNDDQTIDGTIDFNKGDNPIYSDNSNLEVNKNEQAD